MSWEHVGRTLVLSCPLQDCTYVFALRKLDLLYGAPAAVDLSAEDQADLQDFNDPLEAQGVTEAKEDMKPRAEGKPSPKKLRKDARTESVNGEDEVYPSPTEAHWSPSRASQDESHLEETRFR